jgi:glucosamine--fructose-6-phosphate aminotransferase (isomerizing)
MTSRMLREIEEGAAVVERLVRDGHGALANVQKAVERSSPPFVVIVARGSSFHAGLYGRYLVETVLRLPVVLAAPAVTSIYESPVPYPGAIVLVLSQGGRSPDILAVTEAARHEAGLTVAITNDPGSPLASLGDLLVPLDAGPEGIAATKSYVAEIAALAAIVARWSGRDDLLAGLERTPAALARAFAAACRWLDDEPEIIAETAASERALVVSRGYDLATALELALKLKETGAIFADGFSAADLLHGHVVVATADVPFLAIRPAGRAGESVDRALEVASGYGSRPWLLGGPAVAGRRRALSIDHGLPEGLAPLAHIVLGQILAERVARAPGYDPDHPAGLTKVILTD